LLPVEGGKDILRVGVSQGKDGQIHHGEGELALNWFTIGIRDTHGKNHWLAWTSTLRLAGQVYVEILKGRVDR
jgi:hypothetical protein